MNKAQILARMNPELRAVYDELIPYNLQYDALCTFRKTALETSRKMHEGLLQREDLLFQTQTISGAPGNDALSLRIYEPKERHGQLPVLLYMKGGGGCMNAAEELDYQCVDMALKEHCVVINPDYRLAPEFPAPAGQLDCLAAWEWLCVEGAEILNIDLARSAFFGVSGGGNMVLGIALRLLDMGGRQPSLIMPLYPMIDDRGITYSSYEIQDTTIWGREQNMKAWDYYINGLSNKKAEEVCSYIAPARRADFTGLCPVFTFIGELDLFRDETLALVSSLTHSGVPVEFTLYPGCFHAFEYYCPEASISIQAQGAEHAALQRVFHSAP